MREVYDADGSDQLPGTLIRKEGEAALANDEMANEAYDGSGATYDFYLEQFKRNSLDDQGAKLVSTVRVTEDGELMGNAFWTGEQMAYGEGDGVLFSRFTKSLDVMGHELTHGVIQHTSNLDYVGQSGALNEHFADVFGVLIRHRKTGTQATDPDPNTWAIGADIIAEPKVTRRALRDMAAPGTAFTGDPYMGDDPQPGHMKKLYTGKKDNQGVHINSGIPNRAFVLFATTLGGNAWEAAGHIWYNVMKGLVFNSQFQDCANTSVLHARAHGPLVVAAVQKAWKDVGITADDSPEGP